MGFRVRHDGNHGRGWISVPLRGFDDNLPWLREIAPARYAQEFHTLQDAEAAVVEMRARCPEATTFEIVKDDDEAPA